MDTSDPKFDDCLFEVVTLCVPKEMLESLVASFLKSSEFIKMHIFMVINPLSLGDDQSQDDVEHGYYDEDDDSDRDLDESMRHFRLMANLHGYMAGGKEWVLDSGCTDHMTGDFDLNGPRKYVTFGDNSKGKVVGLCKVAISHDSSIQNVMLTFHI